MGETDKPAEAAARATRRETWVKPELSKVRAGDAEFGASPLVPEGAFGTGS